MAREGAVWAVILAGGDGTRLSALTRNPEGQVVPKQFCSLGGASLVAAAVARARALVEPARIMAVVTELHRPFWRRELGELSTANIVVQPSNRGTAAGIALPLLELLHREPEAAVIVLPADHFIAEERLFTEALQRALVALVEEPTRVVLLGIRPDSPEPGYGWLTLGEGRDAAGLAPIATFVEKPEPLRASELLAAGGLVNSFVLVARAAALLELVRSALPGLVAALETAWDGAARAFGAGRLAELYPALPSADFSRDVLEPASAAGRLWALEVPLCGWTDLGTPERLLTVCRRHLGALLAAPSERVGAPPFFDLSRALLAA